MNVSEKVAYLKGLADGLGLDKDEKNGKLIAAIIDTLDSVAVELEDLNENHLAIGEELDAISEDLSDVEEFIFSLDEDDDDCDCDCDCDDCCGDHDEDYVFEVKCPACGAEIEADESDIIMGEIPCPACGEKLEFEFDDDDEDEDDE